MRGAGYALLAGSLLQPFGTASAAEPIVLQPTSKWILNYADDSCALRRTFGDADREVVLEMRRFQPTDSLYFTVASRGLKMTFAPKVKVIFGADADPRVFERAIPVRTATDHEGYTFSSSLRAEEAKDEDVADWDPAAREAREKSVTSLTVTSGFSKPFRIATGSLRAPMEEMRKCTDELLTHWGLDAEAQRSLSRRVTAVDQMEWAKRLQAHYPTSMLSQGQSGIVRVRMTVDPTGAPLSCHIQVKAVEETFERAACDDLMRYAKFEPALDSAGKPVASYFVTSVIYLIN